ncbi:MAG: hypothetical protein HYY49_04030 [Ignavibacteriales bacterium]|nr:hypothetical protein [Ignavibacteriales bacterium]
MARRKKPEAEYRLNIFYHEDRQTKERKLVFLFRTIQEFVSFNYEILLEDTVEGNTLHFNIAGLNAPSSLMPGTGAAHGKREYSDLNGAYTLVVKKLDGTTNAFRLAVSPERVRLLESPKNPIVLVSTEPLMLS